MTSDVTVELKGVETEEGLVELVVEVTALTPSAIMISQEYIFNYIKTIIQVFDSRTSLNFILNVDETYALQACM